MFSKIDKSTRVLFLVGVGILILGIVFLAVNTVMVTGTEECTAVITGITSSGHGEDETYTVYIEYEFDGIEYGATLGYHSSGMRAGDTVTISVNPNNPGKPIGGGFKLFGVIFIIFGTLFTAVIVWMFISGKNNTFAQQKLMKDGKPYEVDVFEVKEDPSIMLNGKSPYILICRMQPGTAVPQYEMTSGRLWFDPAPVLGRYGITKATVYFNQNDPEKYYVDTTELETRYKEMNAEGSLSENNV